jgi:hypothetical protein
MGVRLGISGTLGVGVGSIEPVEVTVARMLGVDVGVGVGIGVDAGCDGVERCGGATRMIARG